MFLNQLFRLFAWLVEFLIVLALLVVFVFGIGLWSHGFTMAGIFIVVGVIWFIIGAVKSRR